MEEIDDELFENLPTGIYRAVADTAQGPATTRPDEGPEAEDMADELATSLPTPELGGSRKSQDVLPLYFDVDSISTKLAAEIIDTLSQLSLRTTGHRLEVVSQGVSSNGQRAGRAKERKARVRRIRRGGRRRTGSVVLPSLGLRSTVDHMPQVKGCLLILAYLLMLAGTVLG